MNVSRRSILAGGAAGVGLAVAGTLPSLSSASAAAPANVLGRNNGHGTGHGHDRGGPAGTARPFPPLVDDPNGILALPAGFSYTIVTNATDLPLARGTKRRTALSGHQGMTPSNHDGTGVVASDRHGYTLIQNHELDRNAERGVPNVHGTVYDPLVTNGGGCTVIHTDSSGSRISEHVGISGTVQNCAGGPTPWGTWLTCEETEQRAQAGSYAKDHGYVFEVFADDIATPPTPLKALGRFAHEAVAVDAKRNRIYLTEDASKPTGLVYRWTAPKRMKLGTGLAHSGLAEVDCGTLEAMQLRLDDGSVLTDVAYLTSAQLGRPFKVTWTPVRDRDARRTPVREQLPDRTVTRGKKFEGIWSDGDGAYIVNSYAFGPSDLPTDATKHDGMVWYYDYADETITLVTYFPHNPQAEADGPYPRFADMVFDGPDNVSVTPWGTLILAEDGTRASHVLSATPGGPTYAIARNMLAIGTEDGATVYSEFTGPTFSPDGNVLFLNIQVPGITLAVTGPWRKYLG